MDEIDRLLAELKAKHDPSAQPDSLSEVIPSDMTPSPTPVPPALSDPIQSLDSLLSQLEEGAKRSVRAELSKHPPKAPLLQPPVAASFSSFDWDNTPSPPQALPLDDPLLAKLKAEQDAKNRAEQLKQEQERREAELRQQREEQEKQRRLAALQAQRRAELAKQAEQWLKNLKPRSEEGLWFDEFACNYESRLEAAIEYLDALQTVERESRKF